MPRYVVHAQIKCVYRYHGADRHGSSESQSRDPDTPTFFPTDWMIELGERSTIPWSDGKGMQHELPTQIVFAHRPMTIEASNEAAAREIAVNCSCSSRSDTPGHFTLNGWIQHESEVSVLTARKLEANRKIRRAFEVDTSKIVAPDIASRQLETDQQFEMLRWMWITGKHYEAPAPYVPWSVRRMLRGQNPKWSESNLEINSQDELLRTISRGILAQGHDIYNMWREDHGIQYGQTATIPAAHIGKSVGTITSEHAGLNVPNALWTAMRDVPGQQLICSPNHYHHKARDVRSFSVIIHEAGFSFRLDYGFPQEELGSSWDHTLATTRGGETFYETANRALEMLHKILPDYRKRYRRQHPLAA